MADYNSTATSTIYVNGKPAEAELQKLKQRASDLRDAIASAAKAGDKASLKKLRSELNQTKREVKEVEGAMHAAEVVMKRLDKATPKELQATLRQLKKELNDMERGTDAWDKQVSAIKRVKAELDSVNDEMKEQQSLLSRIKDKINDWGLSVATAAAAITGLTMTARKAIEAFAEMDAEMANTRKFTGMSAEEVERLNEAFKSMDTRTSREGLNQLAQEAGRLGLQTQDDVLGFVKAADQLNVALDDLGEGATLTLSKLTDIFGDKQRLGVEQSLLSVGSVINELSQNCTASAPYLAQFAQRLAGVGAQARMTIPEIMGFAAVLDSQGQAVEMSATAVSQLITKLFQDPAKIAKATGLELQEFNRVLKEDTNEGLLMLLERLNKLGGIDALAPVLKDMGTDGARASAVISALAGNIDMVRQQQQAANKAFKEGTSVTKEYNVQNNTVQAQLDKAKKGFHEMAVELGQKLAPVMKYAVTGTSALMSVLSKTISFFSEYKVSIIAVTASIAGFTIAVNAATIAEKVKIVMDKLIVFWNETVKASFVKLWATIKANPYAAVVAAVVALAAVIWDLTKKTRNLSQAEQDLISVEKRAINIAADEISTLKMLYKRTQDVTASTKDRKAAVDELQRIYPSYFAKLSDEAILAGQAADQYERLTNAIIAKARAEGAREIIKENSKKIMQLEQERDERVNQLYKDFPGLQYYIASNGGSVLEPGTGRLISEKEAAAKFGYPARIVDAIEKNTAAAVKGYEESNDALAKQVFDIESNTPRVSFTPSAPTPTPYRPGGSGSGRAGGGGRGSTKSDDKFAAEEAWRERQEALLKSNYALRLIDLEEFNRKMLEVEKDFYTKQLNHKDLTELEKVKIQSQYDEVTRKIIVKGNEQTLADVEAANKAALGEAAQRYVDGKSTYEQYTKEVETIETMHLVNMAVIYARLAKEDSNYNAKKLEAEDKIRKKLVENLKKTQDEIEKKKKEHEDKLNKLKDTYFGLNDEEKQALYDETVAALDEVYKLELAKLGDNLEAKLKLEKKYAQAKKKIHDEIFKTEKEQGDEQMKNWEQWVENWLDKIFGEGTWEQYGGFIKSAWSSLMSGYQSLTKLVEAEEQQKLAAMTKKYDAELKAAEGNQHLVNQINKRKAAEEKKIKDEANKRAMAMEIAQAIATTSLGAINAYATTMKAPWPLNMVLAPIAAGMALAAGTIQIATIHKQHAAQAQGYAEGGFTRPGGKHEPAGIVHAGEWVASQKLLASPVARPLIEALDYAQRTNTIGRLGAGGAAAAPVVVTESAELRAVIVRLNERLNEPFVTVNTVSGDHGIKRALDDYNKLQNNTLPKNKRT